MDATTPGPGPAPSPSPARRSLRRAGVILAVWVVAAGGALLVAQALDSPVGEGARDAAQPAGPGQIDDPTAGTTDGLVEGLPPLSLILDRPLPPAIAALPPIRQVAALRARAQRTATARAHVELGSVLQTLGDEVGATAAYRTALRIGGDDPAAEAGLALIEGTRSGDGPARAAARLADLVAARPRDQLLVFNQGWLEIYRRRGDSARAAWERTVELGPATRLGRVATALIASLAPPGSGRNP